MSSNLIVDNLLRMSVTEAHKAHNLVEAVQLCHPLFSMYGRKRRVVEELRELSFRAIESFIDEISYE